MCVEDLRTLYIRSPPRTPKVPPTSPLPPSTSESHLLPLNKSKALDQTASLCEQDIKLFLRIFK
jgi:hypothetical protein